MELYLIWTTTSSGNYKLGVEGFAGCNVHMAQSACREGCAGLPSLPEPKQAGLAAG